MLPAHGDDFRKRWTSCWGSHRWWHGHRHTQLSRLSTGANINLSDGVVDVSGFVSRFTRVEVMIGSSHADTIQGTSISDTLIGGDGSG